MNEKVLNLLLFSLCLCAGKDALFPTFSTYAANSSQFAIGDLAALFYEYFVVTLPPLKCHPWSMSQMTWGKECQACRRRRCFVTWLLGFVLLPFDCLVGLAHCIVAELALIRWGHESCDERHLNFPLIAISVCNAYNPPLIVSNRYLHGPSHVGDRWVFMTLKVCLFSLKHFSFPNPFAGCLNSWML